MQTADRSPSDVAPPDAVPAHPLEPDPDVALRAGAARSVARNTLIMLVSQMVTFGLTFVWTVALQLVLTPADYGKLFFAQSMAWIGAIFMDAGVSTYLSKHVAREREETARLLSSAIMLRTLTTVVVYGVIVAVTYLGGWRDETLWAVAIVTGAIVFTAFTQALAATFQGHENMLWPALGTIVEKTIVTSLSVTVLLLGYGLLAVAGVMLLGAACNLLVVGRRGLQNGWLRLSVDPRMVRAILAGGAPFFLWAAFGVIYQRNAALQLEAVAGSVTTAWFAVAARLYETLSFVPYIFQAAVLPVLARSFVGRSGVDSNATSRRSLDLIVLASMPIAGLVILLAPWVVDLITAGLDEYGNSVLPLQILGLSLVPLYVDMILATILVSADKQKQLAFVAVGAALLNPLFNWFLIEWAMRELDNGAVGSAAVTFLTEAVILVFYVMLVPRGVLNLGNLVYALRVLAAAALMALAVWLALPLLTALAPDGGHGKLGAAAVLIPAGLIGAAVFAGAAWALKVVGRGEIALLRRALRRGG